MLTYWCNARCQSCYICCGPEHRGWVAPETALEIWRQLIEVSPHGCRVHLTGGEPFGNWPLLIEIARRAKTEGLGPLHKVETNGFWATDSKLIRERLIQLDEAGMEKLTISTDPYHQRFVPIEHCRMLASLAEEILGLRRVQVRWRDWLAEGRDTDSLPDAQWRILLAKYAAGGRDRANGRAASVLAELLPQKPPSSFADESCGQQLLRCKHVHVDGDGLVMPGTCAGIALGHISQGGVAEIWKDLQANYDSRPIVGTLSRKGPVGLMEVAKASGYLPRPSYAGKCHLCWDVRNYLLIQGLCDRELSPRWMYDAC